MLLAQTLQRVRRGESADGHVRQAKRQAGQAAHRGGLCLVAELAVLALEVGLALALGDVGYVRLVVRAADD